MKQKLFYDLCQNCKHYSNHWCKKLRRHTNPFHSCDSGENVNRWPALLFVTILGAYAVFLFLVYGE